jgi:hypothetical protein
MRCSDDDRAGMRRGTSDYTVRERVGDLWLVAGRLLKNASKPKSNVRTQGDKDGIWTHPFERGSHWLIA